VGEILFDGLTGDDGMLKILEVFLSKSKLFCRYLQKDLLGLRWILGGRNSLVE